MLHETGAQDLVEMLSLSLSFKASLRLNETYETETPFDKILGPSKAGVSRGI